jgi:hypothetical protein
VIDVAADLAGDRGDDVARRMEEDATRAAITILTANSRP